VRDRGPHSESERGATRARWCLPTRTDSLEPTVATVTVWFNACMLSKGTHELVMLHEMVGCGILRRPRPTAQMFGGRKSDWFYAPPSMRSYHEAQNFVTSQNNALPCYCCSRACRLCRGLRTHGHPRPSQAGELLLPRNAQTEIDSRSVDKKGAHCMN